MAMLQVPDDLLKEAGLSESEAMIELACRLFESGKLPLWSAAKLAGVDRVVMEEALSQRSIPLYRPTLDDLAQDIDTMERIGD
ncbi:MAG: UPF0175 family protein [Pirellulaceae bacterium]|nr:UPF0175 family protein [Pirellulaceae bacterium]